MQISNSRCVHRTWRTLGRLLLLACVVAGCADDNNIGEEQHPRLTGPSLNTVANVELQEDDSVFVSKPNGLLIAPNGSILVSDVALGQVLQFARSGQRVGQFGRKGRGPGEFIVPGFMAVVDDSLLLVRHDASMSVEAFNLPTHQWLWSHRLPAPTTTSIETNGQVLMVSYLDPNKGTSALAFADSLASSRPIGRAPGIVSQNQFVASAFRMSQLASKGDTIAQAFEASNWLYVYSLANSSVDSIHIPLARRKGAPVHLLADVGPGNQDVSMQAVQNVSQPLAIQWIGPTKVAIVTVDPDRTAQHFKGKTFVTVVDVQRRESCVDGSLGVPEDPAPMVAFNGDTVVTLYQEVDQANKAHTFVRFSLIDDSGCSWTK